MKKERFEIYMPLHLRQLRYEIGAFAARKSAERKGLFKKMTKIRRIHIPSEYPTKT